MESVWGIPKPIPLARTWPDTSSLSLLALIVTWSAVRQAFEIEREVYNCIKRLLAILNDLAMCQAAAQLALQPLPERVTELELREPLPETDHVERRNHFTLICNVLAALPAAVSVISISPRPMSERGIRMFA